MSKSEYLRKKIINYSELSGIEDLNSHDRKLLEKAWKNTFSAYAPYSGFYVGAVLELENGKLINGINQENASYPAGLCAERVALFSGGSIHPGKKIKTLVVSARNPDKPLSQPVYPCGFCIQVMLEFEYRQKAPFRLLIGNPETSIILINSASDLMPFSFNPEQLS